MLSSLLHYSSFSLHLSLPTCPCRMLLKCWRRTMNSTRLRVHAWPSGELRLSWRVCPGQCSAWGPLRICPAWGNTLRQSWRYGPESACTHQLTANPSALCGETSAVTKQQCFIWVAILVGFSDNIAFECKVFRSWFSNSQTRRGLKAVSVCKQ